MNYNTLIDNRKSVRAFRDTPVPASVRTQIQTYYETECQKLLPELDTQLLILDTDAREALEGAAGYREFLVGAPAYLVLLTARHPHAEENAGYIMEDLVLKLTDLELDSCWVGFGDAAKVRQALGLTSSDLEVAAIAAFGYGKRTPRKLRLNIENNSKVDIVAQRQFYTPKKSIYELVSLNTLGNEEGLDDVMGFYEDMLWNSFYAVAQSPSYLNRQPYAFILRDKDLVLVQLPDVYTNESNGKLNLGIAMLHFSVIASQWVGKITWDLAAQAPGLALPEGSRVAAVYHM